MKKWNNNIQTVILTISLVLFLTSLIRSTALLFIPFFQIFIGTIQLSEAIYITLLWKRNNVSVNPFLIKYYFLLVIYFVGLFFINQIFEYESFSSVFLLWFFSAWLIALYYYINSIKISKTNFFAHSNGENTN